MSKDDYTHTLSEYRWGDVPLFSDLQHARTIMMAEKVNCF